MSDTGLRDQLAVERTRLANERTLLAYVRTALALAAGGAVLLQFFPAYPSLLWLAWLLIAAGGVTLAVGICRFIVVRGQLNASRG
jgi:putative membrane protein